MFGVDFLVFRWVESISAVVFFFDITRAHAMFGGEWVYSPQRADGRQPAVFTLTHSTWRDQLES